MAHGLPLSGHDGVKRTIAKAETRYFWPKMKTDIRKWCLSCLGCCKRKTSKLNKQGLTQPLTASYVLHKAAFGIVSFPTETKEIDTYTS
jgi:hypothetical protein